MGWKYIPSELFHGAVYYSPKKMTQEPDYLSILRSAGVIEALERHELHNYGRKLAEELARIRPLSFIDKTDEPIRSRDRYGNETISPGNPSSSSIVMVDGGWNGWSDERVNRLIAEYKKYKQYEEAKATAHAKAQVAYAVAASRQAQNPLYKKARTNNARREAAAYANRRKRR